MKLGAENSKKTILAICLFAVALFLAIRMIKGSSGGSAPQAAAPATTLAPQPARPAKRASRAGSRAKAEKTPGPVTPSLDPRLNLLALKEAEDTKYDGTGRNIFMSTEEPRIPTPIAPAMPGKGQDVAKNPGPPPKPMPTPPPPINLKFFGFASGPDHKHVFLANGDDVFVATEGEIVQRRYKIVKINTNSIDVLDVLSNNRQTIPLTAG